MTPILLPKQPKSRKFPNLNPKPPHVSLKRHLLQKLLNLILVGSEQVSDSGERIWENQQTLKNMAGEGLINQPSHVAFS